MPGELSYNSDVRGVVAGVVVSVVLVGAAVIGCELVANITPHEVCATVKTVDETAGLFVRSGGNPGSCTRNAPCGSLADALTVVVADQTKTKTMIYIAAGTYKGSVAIAFDRELTIIGGWDSAFGPLCEATAKPTTTIISGDDGVPAMSVSGDGDLTLELLTIDAGAPPTGGSSYGLFVATVGSPTITLTHVSITAQAGSSGDAGAPGAPGAPAIDAGCVGDPGVAEWGIDGGAGDGGAPGLLGSFDDTGYHPLIAQAGGAGVDGGEGALGSPPDDELCCTTSTNCGNMNKNAGNPGKAGCGGAGGSGGGGGGGGGGSFAIYAWHAIIKTDGCTLVANAGGTGGLGGAGGAGGAPAPGITGSTASCSKLGGYARPASTSGCSAGGCVDASISGGAAGGPGGTGGGGGVGGMGAGGPSCAIVVGGGGDAGIGGQCTNVITSSTACNGESGDGKKFGCAK
jgi:hypothetical protein